MPITRRAFLPLILAASACASGGDPGRQEADRASVEAELASVYHAFTTAYATADVDRLMRDVYAPDAFYLPPGGPILSGQDQFRGQFERFLGPMAAGGGRGPGISFEIVDRDISGDLAYDIGYYTLKSPGAGGDVEGSRGKFVIVWKRDAAGRWRIHADSYSGVD